MGGLLRGPRAPWAAGSLAALGTLLCWGVSCALAQEMETPDYRRFYGIDSRLIVWVVAELHLMFAAFVLGVPMFAVIAEYIGVKTGDPRFDRLAHEFTKLLSAAFSTTASLGGLLTFTLFGLYPKFMNYMSNVLSSNVLHLRPALLRGGLQPLPLLLLVGAAPGPEGTAHQPGDSAQRLRHALDVHRK